MKRTLVIALVLAAGCGDATGSRERRVEVDGRLLIGWETNSFRPCGSEEDWLPYITPEMYAEYQRATGPGFKPAYARFRGTVGPRGKFGIYGVNDRELHVTELVEVYPVTERDCAR